MPALPPITTTVCPASSSSRRRREGIAVLMTPPVSSVRTHATGLQQCRLRRQLRPSLLANQVISELHVDSRDARVSARVDTTDWFSPHGWLLRCVGMNVALSKATPEQIAGQGTVPAHPAQSSQVPGSLVAKSDQVSLAHTCVSGAGHPQSEVCGVRNAEIRDCRPKPFLQSPVAQPLLQCAAPGPAVLTFRARKIRGAPMRHAQPNTQKQSRNPNSAACC